jgi:hypothetical protein
LAVLAELRFSVGEGSAHPPKCRIDFVDVRSDKDNAEAVVRENKDSLKAAR